MPAGLVAACLAAPPGHEPESAAAATAVASADHQDPAPPVDWSRGDCLSQLRTLQQAVQQGRLGPEDGSPFALELVAPAGSWLDGVPDIPIEIDLPLATADPGSVDGAPCVLRIGPARQQRAAHRAVDLQDVHSAYQNALRSERNPDYDAAQLKQRQARDQAKRTQKIVRVGDPLLDLIGSAVGGAIATFDQRSRRQALDEAAAELAATPRSLDRPVYRPYSFERVVVRAQKQALVPVALLDAAGRSVRAVELRQSERREFFLLRGLDPRDRDYEQHRATSMTRADLARWARTPRALRLSSVALALTEDAPAPAMPADEAFAPWPDEAIPDQPAEPWLDEVFADKEPLEAFDDDQDDRAPLPIAGLEVADLVPGLAPARSAAPALHPSVVAIRAGKAGGHGVYVRQDMVLTTYGVVGPISVVDVTTADGATVPALVAAVDPDRDLALLQVPRPGQPAVLHDGPVATAGLPGAGPGYPVFSGDQVIGLGAGAAGGPQGVIGIAAIRGFLDGQAGVFAAVP